MDATWLYLGIEHFNVFFATYPIRTWENELYIGDNKVLKFKKSDPNLVIKYKCQIFNQFSKRVK